MVIIITPLAAREPYIDAEAASLSTCILSMSFMLSELRAVVVGTPSITNNGSCEELNEPIPRIRTVPVPIGEPSVVIVMPGTLPCKERIGSVSADDFRSFVLTTDTEPVKSALRCT